MTYAVALPLRAPFAAWREAARIAVSHSIAPERIDWTDTAGLFPGDALPCDPGPHTARVPPGFVEMARTVIWHSAPQRYALLYKALWRIDRGNGDPLSAADPLGNELHLMAKSVRRDIHKMHAFVRFRELPPEDGRRRFAAWFEPQHHVLEPAAPFFERRFADMDWLIATPGLSASFRKGTLTFHENAARPDLPEDASATLWDTYFRNIFNPARIKVDAMRAEMPRKYWKNLPETRLIPEMLAGAEDRVRKMHAAENALPRPGAARVSVRYRASMPQPAELPLTLDEAQGSAAQCRRCGLCERATQTVWGEGARDAALMVVGEQPGDEEDLAGRPFVGPAGRLLREIMAATSADPKKLWLTNAVKHFKFIPRGKRRLHQNPDRAEIDTCRWWLQQELNFIRPAETLALGASAAFALTGNSAPLRDRRGTIETGLHGGPVMISWHPAYVLRLPDPQQQARARAEIAGDLRHALTRAGSSR